MPKIRVSSILGEFYKMNLQKKFYLLIYEKILNKYEVIEYLYSHSRKENYEYLKNFGGF